MQILMFFIRRRPRPWVTHGLHLARSSREPKDEQRRAPLQPGRSTLRFHSLVDVSCREVTKALSPIFVQQLQQPAAICPQCLRQYGMETMHGCGPGALIRIKAHDPADSFGLVHANAGTCGRGCRAGRQARAPLECRDARG